MSSIGSVLDIGVRGIQQGIRDAQSAAEKVAGVGSDAETSKANGLQDRVEGAVDLLKAENQVKLSARVVEAGSNIIGTIIDDVV